MTKPQVLDSGDRRMKLETLLRQWTAPAAAALSEPCEEGIRCLACGHRCLVKPGRSGVCRVRFHDGQQLRAPQGYVAALACDPVEKKPFFHVLPGSGVLTMGMLGCDFHCGYCQNWISSQTLRDPGALAMPRPISAGQIVDQALRQRAALVASSYNEPLISCEWAAAVFTQARRQGLRCAFVSNGNATPEALDFLGPLVDAFKVDLKSFDPRSYRRLGGVLENVTAAIRMLRQRGFWVEIVTLLVPGFNDGPEELQRMAEFLASVDPLMPWHITAFHPDYRVTEGYRATGVEDLLAAGETGRRAGMRYVYLGNIARGVGGWEDTRCHHCGVTVIQRRGFAVASNRLGPRGECPGCGKLLPGIWPGAGAGEGA